ncbi:MAG TPA: universal stress protein, partial [Terriglobales bacterium]|nr:universal stress protein [Terriglobales bacterium]
SEIAFLSGGIGIKLAVVLSASALLLFAANTAIIGTYHIFLALSKSGFLPRVIALRSEKFNSPHIAILIATIVPIIVILWTQGELDLLGEMYAFGLLGAFFFSSLSLDIIRWRLGRRDIGFWLGLLTTGMILIAWSVNLIEKNLATLFGGGLTVAGMVVALGVRRAWFVEILHQIPAIQRLQARAYRASEALVDEELKGLVTLGDALELKALYPASTLLAVRGESPRLMQEGISRAKGRGDSALYCIYVEEWPGLFDGHTPHRPNEEGIRTLRYVVQAVRGEGLELIPIWTVSHNAAEAIAKAASQLEVDGVLIGASRRSAFYHMLRGHVIKGLMKHLPRNCHLIVCN